MSVLAGVVSLMDLQGAVNMIVNGTDDDDDGASKDGDNQEEKPVHSDSDDNSASSNDGNGEGRDKDDGEEEGVELAVDLIDSIQLGTGARITCLAAWATISDSSTSGMEDTTGAISTTAEDTEEKKSADEPGQIKRKRDDKDVVVMDPDALDKARDLVAKAKKIQKRKQRKNHHNHPPR